MKKTLIAAGVLAALAGSAFADVTVYGKVDTGLTFVSEDSTNMAGVNTKKEQFAMSSGVRAGSRLGFKGREDLGNGMYVSFQLENGFNSDNGALGASNTLFNREASLTLGGNFGRVSFGRMNPMTAGGGTSDMFRVVSDIFDGGLHPHAGNTPFLSRDRFNNMISIVSPEFAGTTLYAQYSLGTSDDAGHTRDHDRYAALGAKYTAGNFTLAAAVDSLMYQNGKTFGGVVADDPSDSLGISLGGNVDFETVKLFVAAQYGKNETAFAGTTNEKMGAKGMSMDGYMLNLGFRTQLLGGKFETVAFYAKADGMNVQANPAIAEGQKEGDFQRYGFTIAQTYDLSKRTNVGGFFGYDETSADKADGAQFFEEQAYVVGISLQHNF